MGRATRYLAIGLMLSLLVNMFLVGFMLGRGGKIVSPKHNEQPAIAGFNLRRFAQHLPANARGQLRDHMRERRGEMEGAYRQVEAAKRAVRNQMTADTIDQAALVAALATMVDAEASLRRMTNQVIAETLATLPPEQRQAVVDALER